MVAAKVEVSGFHYLPSVLVTSSGQSKWTAMIRVKAPPVAESNRAPIHVVVVLHHAGKINRGAEPSSSREPSRFDLLKTMEFIIEQIRENGKGDHLTIVAESKGDISEMSIDDWDPQKGESLEKEGTRALSKEGLQRAVKILQKESESGAKRKRAGFILLLSDAPSELKCADSLLSKYPVHVFGLSYHDPSALHYIAEKSKGTYSCITETGKNLNSRFTEAIGLCLVGLKTVVAVDTHVEIEVARFRQQTNAKASSVMKKFKIKIQSGGYGNTSLVGNNSRDGDWASGKISIGVLYADEVKHFIVHIDFTSDNTAEKTRAAVLTAEVKYKNSSHKDVQSQCELPLLVTMISDPAAIEGYERLQQLVPCRHIVLQQMIWFDVLEKLDSFAKDELKKKGNNLGAALQTKWDELKNSESFRMAREMDLDLGRIRDDMDAMVKCLNGARGSGSGGLGLGSIYSCLSSYQMQRVTTTGLQRPAPATTFLTPAMEEMLETARKRTKSEYATGLFDKVEMLLDWFKMYPTTKASSCSGGSDESYKHVVDFIESLIYKAAHLAVQQWRGTTSGKPVHSTPAAPPPPVEGDLTVDEAKSERAIGLLDKIVKLLNLSKTCLTMKASSSEGASDESQKRADDLIRRLIYEVAAATMEEWWRATSGEGTPVTPTPPPVEEGDAKSKHAIGLLDRIEELLDWSTKFPGTNTSSTGGAGNVSQKRVDDLIRLLIYETAVVAVKEWRIISYGEQMRNDTPPEGSPAVKTKYAIRLFNKVKEQLDFFEKDPNRKAPSSSRGAADESLQTEDIEQRRIYKAAVHEINTWRATTDKPPHQM